MMQDISTQKFLSTAEYKKTCTLQLIDINDLP